MACTHKISETLKSTDIWYLNTYYIAYTLVAYTFTWNEAINRTLVDRFVVYTLRLNYISLDFTRSNKQVDNLYKRWRINALRRYIINSSIIIVHYSLFIYYYIFLLNNCSELETLIINGKKSMLHISGTYNNYLN